MAIKINNKDLARRVINGQDVQRVILNGSQIRPTEQKYIDYHVISNRGTGGGGGGSGVPGGWSTGGGGGGGGAVVGESGVSNGWDTAGGSQGTADLQYVGLPSLLNARKVEIIYSFYWNQTSTSRPFESYLTYNETDSYKACINELAAVYSTWQLYLQSTGIYQTEIFDGYFSHEGNYVMSVELDLVDGPAKIKLEGPSGFSKEFQLFENMSSEDIFNIRHSTDFWIILNDGVILSRVDFLVDNN